MIKLDASIEIKSFKQLNETLDLLNFIPDAIVTSGKENNYQIYKYNSYNSMKEDIIKFIDTQFDKVFVSDYISIYNTKNNENEVTNAFIIKNSDIKKIANAAKICNDFGIINLLNGSILVEFYCPDIDFIELIIKFTSYINIDISNKINNIKYYKLEELLSNNIIEKYDKNVDYLYKCNLDALIKYNYLSKYIIAMYYNDCNDEYTTFILGDEFNLSRYKLFFPNSNNINIYIPEIKFINNDDLYKEIKNNTKIFRLSKNSLILYKEVKYILSLLSIYDQFPAFFNKFKVSYKYKMLYLTIETNIDLESDEHVKEQEEFIEFINYLNELD